MDENRQWALQHLQAAHYPANRLNRTSGCGHAGMQHGDMKEYRLFENDSLIFSDSYLQGILLGKM